jgi:hypothetical protein
MAPSSREVPSKDLKICGVQLGSLQFKHVHFKITGQHILDGDDHRCLSGITKQPPLASNILMETISRQRDSTIFFEIRFF